MKQSIFTAINQLNQSRKLSVTFTRDMTGMIIITYSDGEHQHVGEPFGTIQELEKEVLRELCRKYEE